ncbi:Hypothetical Protein FCC1311_075952 [Hondaea fermentalgiana]|uniref:Uncharacterized protein n=1 Tax=Hondaea fermentalgiana TaxID=2315210 RepID=A0A2R5GSL9_9STRA|nr:Hypothetical Protein FCC1311_075952 [Hondaea fermentalgiana]|eukprot:GBG31371.1 Hypothetical Protein FCC1311_075952 [Hondaea fermentalgiana]
MTDERGERDERASSVVTESSGALADGPRALRELETLADALAVKAGEQVLLASQEREASQARGESALLARVNGLEAQVRALRHERDALLASSGARMSEALAIERDAIETAIAASKRAQRLHDELAQERLESSRLDEALASVQETLEHEQSTRDLETTRGLDVQMELAQRLERETALRRERDESLAKVSAALQREQRLHKKAKEKIKTHEMRLAQLDNVNLENATLKENLEEMRRLLRAVSKQKPLFDRIHRLERKHGSAQRTLV